MCRQAFEIQGLDALTNYQLHVLVSGFVEVFEEGQRHVPQTVSARRQCPEFPEAHTDLVLTVIHSLECAMDDQLPTQSVNSR